MKTIKEVLCLLFLFLFFVPHVFWSGRANHGAKTACIHARDSY